jgi:hypothetical protein
LGYSFSLRRRLWWGLCGVVVLVLLALNLYQLYGVVPRYYEFVPPVALILREAQAKSSDWHIFYIANKAIENHASNTERVMRLNGYGPRFHRFHDDDLFNGKLWTMLIKPAIIVVDTRKADVERILKEIRERLPHAREEEALATWGKATMQFFYLDKQIELTSPGPLNFTASYDLRSIASRDCYGMVDVTGFEDGTIVVISPVKQESYGIVIADGGKNVTSWLCAKDEGIAWRRARLVPEGPGLMWVVCVHKRPPMVGLYELNGRKIWSESVGEHRLGCGTCTRDGGLLVVSLGGERVWHLDHEGKIEERLCVDMPARELRISAMAVGPDGYIYLVDEAGKKILVLNKDLVFQGEFASPVPFGKEVRLIAGEDKLLYLASGNSLAAIDLSGLERGKDASGLGWTVKLDDFSVCGLTMLGKDRIAIADFSHRGHYPMIWIAEVKPVEQDNVIVPPDAKESSRNTVPVTVVPSL